MYEIGRHYVGDWHTHPTPRPVPSQIDEANIRECVNRSNHDLTGFIHVIVGTLSVPEGLCVLFCDGVSVDILDAASS